jgi:hypothetical protein
MSLLSLSETQTQATRVSTERAQRVPESERNPLTSTASPQVERYFTINLKADDTSAGRPVPA